MTAEGTLLALQSYEEEEFERLFEVHLSLPSETTDFSKLLSLDLEYAEYYNKYERPSYTNWEEYKAQMRRDMVHFNDLAKGYLVAGLQHGGRRYCDLSAMNELASRLGLAGSPLWTPDELVTTLIRIPIVHNGTLTARAGTLESVGLPQAIPVVRASSVYSNAFLFMCQLLVRRTFDCPDSKTLRLRPDRYDIHRLQQHARFFVELIALWLTGEPISVPPADTDTITLSLRLMGPPQAQQEGAAIHCLRTGYGYFEVLHEFGHIVAGDWLKPANSFSKYDEIKADEFAVLCLLNGSHEHPAALIYALRGAHVFLSVLQLGEHLYGRNASHPDAQSRSRSIYDLTRENLSDKELEFYDYLDEIEALTAFLHRPSKYGGVSSLGRIDRFGDTSWPDPFDDIEAT